MRSLLGEESSSDPASHVEIYMIRIREAGSRSQALSWCVIDVDICFFFSALDRAEAGPGWPSPVVRNRGSGVEIILSVTQVQRFSYLVFTSNLSNNKYVNVFPNPKWLGFWRSRSSLCFCLRYSLCIVFRGPCDATIHFLLFIQSGSNPRPVRHTRRRTEDGDLNK